MKRIIQIFQLVFVLCLILTIHEYGHFSEMRKRGVDIQEFSIGIGWPIYQYHSGSTVFSLRAIPVMAYVSPSKAGEETIENKISFWGRFIIFSAGVRNNLISGLCGVFLLQALSLYPKYLVLEVLMYPLRILALFGSFVISFFSDKGVFLVYKYRFPVLKSSLYNFHLNRFIWWSFALGFLNFMPLGMFDGEKIFMNALSLFAGPKILYYASWFAFAAFWYLFVTGIQVGEFVDYDDEDLE